MNQNVFKKSNSNSKVKQLEDKSLLFFGEIEINSIKYFKYACHKLDTDITFLELCERNLNNQNTKLLFTDETLPMNASKRNLRHHPRSRQKFINKSVLLEIKKIEINRISVPDLVSVYDFIRSQKPNNSSHNILHYITDYLRSDSKLRNNRPTNTRKPRTTLKREEYTGNTFRVDPDHIILSELEYNRRSPFKIIRKSFTNLTRINHPFIFFGVIEIDGIKYYRYVCYNSKDIGSFHGVAFRELVHGRMSRMSRIRTNMDSQNLGLNLFDSSIVRSNRNRPPRSSIEMQPKKYLYYIPIEEINSAELRRLIKNIDEYRIQENSSFSRTIYNYVKGELQARCKNENNPFGLINNGITNSNL